MMSLDSCHMMEKGLSCLPLRPEEEKRIVSELANRSDANLREGNLYYVISNRYVFFFLFLLKGKGISYLFPDSCKFLMAISDPASVFSVSVAYRQKKNLYIKTTALIRCRFLVS